MKNKRIVCFFLALATCLLSGCFLRKPYTFLYDITEIEQISIVYMTDANQVSNKYDTIFIVEDKDVFLEDFNKIQFDMYLIGDPNYVFDGDYVILVEYKNGDSEFIGWDVQDIFKNGRYISGGLNCNKEEFENFINSYLYPDS